MKEIHVNTVQMVLTEERGVKMLLETPEGKVDVIFPKWCVNALLCVIADVEADQYFRENPIELKRRMQRTHEWVRTGRIDFSDEQIPATVCEGDQSA